MEDEDDRAEGGEDRQQESAGGLERHRDRAEDHHQQDDGQSDDEDAEGQQRLAELVGDVDLDRRGSGDGRVEVEVVLDLIAEVPQPVDGVQRRRIVGGRGRDDLEQRGRGVPVGGGHDDLVDAVDVFDAVLDPLDVIERIVAGHDLAGHDQRAVEAGSEVLVDEIVGRPCRGALLLVARGGQGQLELGGGDGEECEPADDDDDRQQRNLRHDLQPAGEERVHDRLRIGLARLGARMDRCLLPGRDPRRGGREGLSVPLGRLRGDPGLREPEERRDHRQGDEHGHGHRPRGADAHDGEEGDAGQGESEQGDHHRHAGEDDGGSGRGDRASGRLQGVVALGEQGSGAGDDEQRVVDAHRQAEHEREHDRRGVDRTEGRASDDEQHGDADADERGDQRHAGGAEGSEGEQEDDEGDGHADAFDPGDRDAGDLEQLAAALDLCSGQVVPQRIERIEEFVAGVFADLLLGAVVLDGDHGRRLIIADGAVDHRRIGGGHLVDVRQVLEPIDLVLDRVLVLRVLDRITVLGDDDHRGRDSGRLGEGRLHRVESGLRLGAGQGEVVVEVLGEGGDSGTDECEDEQPRGDEPPRGPVRTTAQGVEES